MTHSEMLTYLYIKLTKICLSFMKEGRKEGRKEGSREGTKERITVLTKTVNVDARVSL